MARKRVEDTVPALESWDDVNQALATIADNQRTVENFEAAMQNKIDEAKAEAEARSRVFIEATKRLERQIKEFAEAHRDDMDGKKTKTLNFGAVGFRKSTKIKLPKAPTKLAEIIQLLRSKGMDDKHARNCIEAMKAMLAGGRGERKGGHDGEVDGPADH